MLLARGFATCEKQRFETNKNSSNNRIGMDLRELKRNKNRDKDSGGMPNPCFQFFNSYLCGT
jgi:hypothetical protein